MVMERVELLSIDDKNIQSVGNILQISHTSITSS
jgi:hypothetical protein